MFAKRVASYLLEERLIFFPIFANKGLPVDFKELRRTKKGHMASLEPHTGTKHPCLRSSITIVDAVSPGSFFSDAESTSLSAQH